MAKFGEKISLTILALTIYWTAFKLYFFFTEH